MWAGQDAGSTVFSCHGGKWVSPHKGRFSEREDEGRTAVRVRGWTPIWYRFLPPTSALSSLKYAQTLFKLLETFELLSVAMLSTLFLCPPEEVLALN